MAELAQFTIGADAVGVDGVCGEVSRVVIDPVARVVTHLVVEPKHGLGPGRLVPLDVVDDTTGEVRLGCTLGEFEQFDAAEDTQLVAVPGDPGSIGGYGMGQLLSWPFYGLRDPSGMVTYDTVPVGEVAVRRGEQVHAIDGPIGRVQGLVINPSDGHVTHVLLQEGHLWGRREVAIPISAVTRLDDTVRFPITEQTAGRRRTAGQLGQYDYGIRLNITKQQVQDLPPVDIDHS